MPTNFPKYLTALLCLANIAYADYWRLTLDNYTCIEPREWETDHVYFRMNLVTRGQDGNVRQNETTDRNGSSYVDRGDRSDHDVMWKDITIDAGDTDLLFTFAAWNIGDEDPQIVGFEIAQLVLKVLRGSLVVSVIASAVSLFLGQLSNAYQCHGPVMLAVVPYTRADLMGMPYNDRTCWTREYTFTTGGGCIDDQPLNLDSKESKYVAQDCIERFQGTSSETGEFDRPGSAGNRIEPFGRLFGFGTGAIVLLALWFNSV